MTQLRVMDFSILRALEAQREGKAIPAHPALQSSEPISTYARGKGSQQGLISQREAPRHMEAYAGDQAIDWVFDCINLYSDPCSTAPYKLIRKDGTKLVKERLKGTPPDHEVGPADLYRLLEAPNPYMLYDELISLLVIDLMLVGNCYWFKWRTTSDGKPLALYRLSPSYVKILPGPFGPKRYEYKPPGAKDALKIQPDQIIHFRRPNPHDAHYGLGVIQGGGRSFDLELAITDAMASYYENKADPSMIVQSERRVPRDVFTKLRAQLRSRLQGTRRSGELLVLEAGLKATTLSPHARDALFHELSQMSRDRVYAKFRVSPLLFGLIDEAAGASKVSDARREFDNATLRPFMDRLQRKITAALTAAWDAEFVIDYTYQMPPEEAVKVAGAIASVPGVKVREVRAQYRQFGIEESTGDPEIDELVLNLPGEEMDEDGQGGFADRNLPGEAGRPPDGENTRSFGTPAKVRPIRPAGKALSVDQRLERLNDILRLEGKALAPDGAKISIGRHLEDERAPLDRFAASRKVDIDEATNFIVDGLSEAAIALEREMLSHVDGKALKASDLVGRIRRSHAWQEFKSQITTVLEEGARRAAQSGVIHSGVEPEDEVDYDLIVKSTVHRPDGVRGILRTLKERVVRRVTEARDAHAERHEFESVVREVIREWTRNQAVMIADTEATHAYNEATLAAAEAAGIEEVYVTDGEDHDEPCREAHGSVWKIAEARERRIEHPRCRRAFLPLPSEA